MRGARGVAFALEWSSLVVRAFGGLVAQGLLMGFLMEFQPSMAAETGSQARVVFDLGVEPAALVGGMSWIVGAFSLDFV
jgi:hypothetical protein